MAKIRAKSGADNGCIEATLPGSGRRSNKKKPNQPAAKNNAPFRLGARTRISDTDQRNS
jgi:hypothetical protein